MLRRLAILWQDNLPLLTAAMKGPVAKNAGALYVVQFADYIIPLVTVPYLVRVLGPAGFGLLGFTQSLITYFILLTDYGFALSATRKIAVERADRDKVSNLAAHVWAAKVTLALIGALILIFLATFVPQIHEVRPLLIAFYGMVIGSVLMPAWLFQGQERMVLMAGINLISKVLMAAGIFLFVRDASGYLITAQIMGVTAILGGLSAAIVSIIIFRLRLVIPTLRGTAEVLRSGWLLFISQAAVSVYATGNAFILGLFAPPAAVGYYTAAERIAKVGIGLLAPLSQAAFPRFSQMAKASLLQLAGWGTRMAIGMGAVGLGVGSALFVGAPWIVRVLLGAEFEPAVPILRLLAFLPLLVGLSNVFGIQMLVPLGKDGLFAGILLGAGIVNIVLAVMLAPLWQGIGVALAFLAAEVVVTAGMAAIAWRTLRAHIAKRTA